MSFPTLNEMGKLIDQQLLHKQLMVGEYQGHRYMICYYPRSEGPYKRYLKPSVGYFEVKSKEEAIRFEQNSQGNVTWLWYPDNETRKSKTEELIIGLDYKTEVGTDTPANSLEEMVRHMKWFIDVFISEKTRRTTTAIKRTKKTEVTQQKKQKTKK